MKLSEMSFEQTNKGSEKKVKEEYEKLQGLSQEQLMERLLSEVAMQKKHGSFDYDGLVKTIESMKEYLPQATYKNILNILDQIK